MPPRLGLVAPHDERIKAGLGDDVHVGVAPISVGNSDGILFIII